MEGWCSAYLLEFQTKNDERIDRGIMMEMLGSLFPALLPCGTHFKSESMSIRLDVWQN